MNGHLSAEWWVAFILINLYYGLNVDPKYDKVVTIFSLVGLTIINVVLLFLRFI